MAFGLEVPMRLRVAGDGEVVLLAGDVATGRCDDVAMVNRFLAHLKGRNFARAQAAYRSGPGHHATEDGRRLGFSGLTPVGVLCLIGVAVSS